MPEVQEQDAGQDMTTRQLTNNHKGFEYFRALILYGWIEGIQGHEILETGVPCLGASLI